MKYGDPMKISEPLAWLYRTADRQCFDLLAKRRKSGLGRDSEAALRDAEEPRTSGLSPERTQLVRQVLGQCNDRVREIAVLYYIDEMTQDEVAHTVGCSRKTVKEKLAQFMNASRALLKGHDQMEKES
jgi:RNA polymerase sigma-70 factor (ECF subfamily)